MKLNIVGTDDCNLAVLQEHHVLCIGKQRRYVRSDECLANPKSDDQRRAISGGHDLPAGGFGRDDNNSVHALDFLKSATNCGMKLAIEIRLNQVRQNFSIRCAGETMSFRDELAL